MADVAVMVHWTGEGLIFDGEAVGGPGMRIDGNGRAAPSPMRLFLLSLASCTASDVVEILGKMRVPLGGLELRVDGDRAAEPPRRYLRVNISYQVNGIDRSDEERVRRAVALSHEKYCSVLHSLRSDIEISSEIRLA